MHRIFLFIVSISCWVAATAQEKLNLEVINKIRHEALNNSRVMDFAFYLTDVMGPRLSKSQGYDRAANWAVTELKKMGTENAGLEPWGEFGKAWELQKSYLAMTAPYYRPLIAFPKSWTRSTKGLQQGDVILLNAKDSVELAGYSGKLKGKIIIINRTDTMTLGFKPSATRVTDEDLIKLANAPMPTAGRRPGDTSQAQRPRTDFRQAARLLAQLRMMAEKEEAIAILSMSPRGHDGTLFVQGGGAYAANAPDNFLDIMIGFEDYMTICRLLRANIPVKLEAEVKTATSTSDTKGYNVIAEIPGTDPRLKDEIVMLGGHLDSWHSAMGATDNASGCSVMMEAMRILKTLNIQPRRTIRIALWNGEEQGLLGSAAYVRNHFGDAGTMQLKPGHEKLSAYFNLDGGTGRIRGIHLQGNEKVKDIFSQWLQPFHDLGAKTVTLSNTGSTDHMSFDRVGLPGFEFIQDDIEYNTRTHHTNMDTYDHLIADDLRQAAAIVTSFVYNAAMRDEKLPRKNLPQPRNAAERGF